jgi:succinyl-diaminopimelate desuccinylase
MPSPTLQLTKELISRPSVTPNDEGCQALIAERLEKIGFQIENLRFGEVDNLYAVYDGNKGGNPAGPTLVFLGHTDVVPSGPTDAWQTPPFEPVEKDGMLYGRGAADMKGSVAAMVTAFESVFAEQPTINGRVALLLTSDEEGIAQDGVKKFAQVFKERGENLTWCLVGEPSSTNTLGDVVKNGRRGSLTGYLTVKGVQGHVAYPHLAKNPSHLAAAALAELAATEWDKGNDFFPPTSFQIFDLHMGDGTTNLVPGELTAGFNFRYCTESTQDSLKSRVLETLDKHGFEYEIRWHLSGEPFLTSTGKLIEAAQSAIKNVVGIDTELSTAGGTSDGRFIAPLGVEVLELGPINATIHKVDECVNIEALDQLSKIYAQICKHLIGPK